MEEPVENLVRCSKCLESIAFSVLDGADSAENLVEMEDVKENIFSLCPINRSHVSICLLGPSGAGKTYIINFMLGMWNDMLVRSAPKYATDFMEMLDWDVSKVHAKASKKDFLENQACSLEGYIDFMLTRKCFVAALSEVFGGRTGGKEHVGYREGYRLLKMHNEEVRQAEETSTKLDDMLRHASSQEEASRTKNALTP